MDFSFHEYCNKILEKYENINLKTLGNFKKNYAIFWEILIF